MIGEHLCFSSRARVFIYMRERKWYARVTSSASMGDYITLVRYCVHNVLCRIRSRRYVWLYNFEAIVLYIENDPFFQGFRNLTIIIINHANLFLFYFFALVVPSFHDNNGTYYCLCLSLCLCTSPLSAHIDYLFATHGRIYLLDVIYVHLVSLELNYGLVVDSLNEHWTQCVLSPNPWTIDLFCDWIDIPIMS